MIQLRRKTLSKLYHLHACRIEGMCANHFRVKPSHSPVRPARPGHACISIERYLASSGVSFLHELSCRACIIQYPSSARIVRISIHACVGTMHGSRAHTVVRARSKASSRQYPCPCLGLVVFFFLSFFRFISCSRTGHLAAVYVAFIAATHCRRQASALDS